MLRIRCLYPRPEETGFYALPDKLVEKMHLKNDAALARALCIEQPTLSKIRHGKLRIGSLMLMRMHELTGLQIRDLKDLINDNPRKSA